MNIKVTYLYRDAGNYKQSGEFVCRNPDNLPLEEIERRFKAALREEQFFIARQVRVPEVFFPRLNSDDHCWHEFESVSETRAVPREAFARTITRLLQEFEQAAKAGWQEYVRTPVNVKAAAALLWGD